ncbi:hypothetical protein HYC85_025954 [Camellia sinensis]|uniref:Uncharacterized protein n=1 Tax=Camellia sinensis TaxID=4442 RepID=A0A7J7G3B6_CAMSI|nr:hypothetical protein HYC85_025954 [Camellia sinensis]
MPNKPQVSKNEITSTRYQARDDISKQRHEVSHCQQLVSVTTCREGTQCRISYN